MDVIDAMLADQRSADLRRARPDYVRYSQGSHEVLIVPADPGGLSLAERAAAAWRISVLNHADTLATHYEALLDPATMTALHTNAALPPRQRAILAHVALVATLPGTATAADLRHLQDCGLSPHDIVSLSQLIAFVSYQVRVLAGMTLLTQEKTR